VNAFLDSFDVEVQKETNTVTGELEVGQELSLVDREHFLDVFQFHDNAAGDDQIHA